MRKFSVIRALASAAVLLAVVSCADLLQGNIFENFDGPPGAGEVLGKYVQADGTVAPQQAGAFVRDLEDATSSPRFFRDLSAADRGKLTGALESVYEGGEDVALPVRQKAAILAGEVNMRGTDAGATANNVIDVLTGDGIDTFEDPRSLLDEIIPAGAKGDPIQIKAILDNLVAAGNAYDAFGATLGGDNTAPAGTNMGTVAQNALVAITVRNIVAKNGDSAALAALIVDPEGEIDAPEGDVFGGEGSALRNIFDAAGLGGVLGD